mgnify:CR=1 FL=1
MSMGFYNKYIFLNNSYLSMHIARQTYQKNKDYKNINEIIDIELNKQKIKNSLTTIKQKVQKKKTIKKKIIITIPKVNSVNKTEEKTAKKIEEKTVKKDKKINYKSITTKKQMKPKVLIDEDEIKVKIVSPKKEEIKEKRKFNSNNASITNRICNSN